MRALVRRGVRETTNYTQTSPRGSTGQAYQFRYQREWPACSRPVTQRGHALTHVQTQAKSTVLPISPQFEHRVLRERVCSFNLLRDSLRKVNRYVGIYSK